MTDEAPPVTPASTTTTKTETVKTTVGAELANGTPSVVVVTQSKIALLSQAQVSACAFLFTLTLCAGFLAPIVTGGATIITAGEIIGVAAGVIGGVAAAGAMAHRNVPMRSTDVARGSTPTPAA